MLNFDLVKHATIKGAKKYKVTIFAPHAENINEHFEKVIYADGVSTDEGVYEFYVKLQNNLGTWTEMICSSPLNLTIIHSISPNE